jgi:hypothetical protein
MAESTVALPPERSRRMNLGWAPLAIFRPRQLFTKLAAHEQGVWLAALLVLTLAALLRVAVQGGIEQAAALSGGMSLPPDFDYYSPEQQAQFMQAAQAATGPVFLYVLPAISAVLGVWLRWLVLSGLLHLLLTMLGGRGTTALTTSIVAWSSLPLAVRDLVRVVAMLIGGRTIASPGLSGFVAADAGWIMLVVVGLLAQVDLYVIWHTVLLGLGLVTASPTLSRAKAVASAVIGVLVIVLAQASLSALGAGLSSLSIMRPFFF